MSFHQERIDEPIFLNNTIYISNKVKYLGVVLVRKLNWKDHIQKRANKSHRCWAACKRAMGSKWDFNPKTILWLFKSVIGPVITHASVVWWTTMDKKFNSKILQKSKAFAVQWGQHHLGFQRQFYMYTKQIFGYGTRRPSRP